ncbi:dihydrolipoamide acetyltransferase family protein [Streptomyces sp. MH60]|uniref:dihydrolipoamide acetyltransferase family protein n=1 Tax=Streptomyces sp. MH60 TaxID=1940758 RepID=UPI000CED87FB|nr:dihydrolipoamide acetyltransferase family protein [Streptomyces sp. MH60]PPS90807.1 Dihydrolipoyllysine-residue acetyltransferase component of pyruvate dehydrogenase complex [Streptomyces sp. MH60]
MAELMRVPEVAAGATDVIMGEWLVPEGAELTAGAPLAVVETDKAQVEVEAETETVLLRTLVRPGTRVPVGAPMALLGTHAERDSDLDAVLAGLGVEAVGTPEEAGPEAPPAQDAPPADVSSVSPAEAPEPAGPQEPGTAFSGGRRFASPLARRLLRTAGIDIATVTGSGPGGRVVRRDAEEAVQRAAQASAPPAPPTPAVAAGDTGAQLPLGFGEPAQVTPHSRLRRAIAIRLTQSKREVPHFYLKRSVEVDALLRLRADLNAGADVRISVNDLLVKAVAAAHTAVPQANVVWTEDALLHYESADVAVAIASERGLVTPVLRGVGEKSVGLVSAEVRRFVRAAEEGALRQRDLEGGSITVTNLGMHGVDEFSAIINPPQSMILAVGAIRSVPVVREAEVVAASSLSLVLSVDHRAVDGALAARWLDALVDAVARPYRLLV